MNLAPFFLVWGIVATATIVLAIYRAVLGTHEDESLHVLDGGARLVLEQQALFKKLGAVERWTKIFLLVTLAYGLLLGGIYLYQLTQTT